MAILFNKLTHIWTEGNIEDVIQPEDWIENPIFTDLTRAQELGPKFWKYTDNIIDVYTNEEININSVFVADALAKKNKQLQDVFDEHLYKTVQYSNNIFNIDIKSRQDLQLISNFADKSLSGGIQWPSSFTWKDINNNDISFTAQQIIELETTIFSYSIACFQHFWQLKQDLSDLTTINTIEVFDINSGWPVYGVDYNTVSVGDKYLNSRASKVLSINVSTPTSPYIQKNTQQYCTVNRFIHPGNQSGVITNISIVASTTGTGMGSVRIVNSDTLEVIVENVNINSNTFSIINMGDITTPPSNVSIFEVQAKTSNINTYVNISNITITY